MEENNQLDNGKNLATIVYDGWVKRIGGDYVTIELDTPKGTKDIYLEIDDCVNRKLPELGRAIRYRTTLEYAPDLESDFEPIVEIKELRLKPGNTGVYKIGE